MSFLRPTRRPLLKAFKGAIAVAFLGGCRLGPADDYADYDASPDTNDAASAFDSGTDANAAIDATVETDADSDFDAETGDAGDAGDADIGDARVDGD